MTNLFSRLVKTSLIALLAMCLFRARASDSVTVKLPAPRITGDLSLELTLHKRRSVREYTDAPLQLADVSQLLWAAQGVTHPEGLRTAPSAGALYPLEVYLVAAKIDSLAVGVYRYLSQGHELIRISDGDKRRELFRAAWEQACVRDAPAVIIITAVYERTMKKYSQRGVQYAHIEVGCAAENIHLQAVALGLGNVFVGAFSDGEVNRILNLSKGEQPLAIIPIGKPK